MKDDPLTKSIYWHPLHKAVVEKDVSYIKGYLDGTLSIEISQEHAESLTDQAYKWKILEGLPGDWRMWFKKRLEALGYFPCGFLRPHSICFPTLLHVFFVSIDETPKMLENLRNPNKLSEEQLKKVEDLCEWSEWDDDVPRLATPAIERTLVVLQPIDQTAAKVMGKDK